MRKYVLILFTFLMVSSSCSSTKTVSNSKADKIVAIAKSYIGIKYRYGGTSRRGMDCSGLVYTAFGKENIQLPRVSRFMAKKGKRISLKKVKKGDLVFFETLNRGRINHVGVVSFAKDGVVKFIHSTNSRGVIESSMSQKYWKKAFIKATTVL